MLLERETVRGRAPTSLTLVLLQESKRLLDILRHGACVKKCDATCVDLACMRIEAPCPCHSGKLADRWFAVNDDGTELSWSRVCCFNSLSLSSPVCGQCNKSKTKRASGLFNRLKKRKSRSTESARPELEPRRRAG